MFIVKFAIFKAICYNWSMKKVDRKEIAEYLGKTTQTVSGWKQKQPRLLELVRLGMLCIKNEINEEKLNKLTELQEMIKRSSSD